MNFGRKLEKAKVFFDDSKLAFVLSIIILVYLLLGGALFYELEHENEVRMGAEQMNMTKMLMQLHNISKRDLESMLKAYHIDLKYDEDFSPRWDFVGSIGFACTVITTIGFGHASPSTFYGQLACIIYALIGIPMNFLLLNMILESSFTFLAGLLSKLYELKPQVFRPHQPGQTPLGRTLLLSVFIFSAFISLISVYFSFLEDWSYFEGIYFTVVAFTSVGLGDFAPSKIHNPKNNHLAYRVTNWLIIIMGLSITYVILNITATFFKNILVTAIDCFNSYFIQKKVSILPEAAPYNIPVSNRMDSYGSMLSFVDENAYIGSFAAVNKAIRKVEQRELDSENKIYQLKALKHIEAVLMNEYMKVKSVFGDDPVSRWKRAAKKVRSFSLVKPNTLKQPEPKIHLQNLHVPSSPFNRIHNTTSGIVK